ncbi:MAG: tetratricopeptide repeat protein, partial [Candidatus Heimdallarchaeaceae archaeon]
MNEIESNAKMFFLKGKEDFKKGDYQNSIRNLIYAQEMYSSMGNKKLSAETLFMIAEAYTNINQITQARQMYSLAFSRFRELGETEKIGKCAFALGRIYSGEGNFKRSKQFLAEAIEAFTKLKWIEKLGDTW